MNKKAINVFSVNGFFVETVNWAITLKCTPSVILLKENLILGALKVSL